MSVSFRPPLPGNGLPLTHSPLREVVSGSVTRRVPIPRLLGVLKWQLGRSLFGVPAWGPSRPHFVWEGQRTKVPESRCNRHELIRRAI